MFFFFNDTATTEIYTLSLHDALPISAIGRPVHFYLDAIDEAALDVRFYRLQGADGLLCTCVQDQAGFYLFPCIQPDSSPPAYRATVDEDHRVNSAGIVTAKFECHRHAFVFGVAKAERYMPGPPVRC